MSNARLAPSSIDLDCSDELKYDYAYESIQMNSAAHQKFGFLFLYSFTEKGVFWFDLINQSWK